MKFISLLSAVLAFALSAAYAKRERATLQFFPAPRRFPPEYRIHANLLESGTSHEIILRTKEPNWLAGYPEETRGVVDYTELPRGQYGAIINDNDAKGGDKTFRIDLARAGAEFHYEGTSVTDKYVDDLPADGYVRALNEDGY
ncbi:predicted protein [Lichtheimia corymbifera JMRC:FSU:9682]|uniref:Uncharacterized protein n=1 Tax=Lichtheimia corymbifera JMRC:FSU:9682 TaxID=1263082 RepID=A0A068RM43_9FUNG|nr:predicted protein [Lichtheimia corymbifera JMRC:FSU:9682]